MPSSEDGGPITSTKVIDVPGLQSASPKPGSTATGAPGLQGNHGSGSSSLSGGAIAGIVIGCVAGVAILALIATSILRRRSRQRRTLNAQSMFEPWQTAPAVDDMPYEKPFPMQEQPSFPPDTGAATTGAYYDGGADPNYPNYGQFDHTAGSPYPAFPYTDNAVAGGMAGAGAGGMAGAGAGAAYAGYNADGTPIGEVHGQQPLMDTGAGAAGVGAAAAAGAAGVGAAGAAAAAAGGNQRQSMVGVPAPAGLHDNMQVNVKVGFVRSLEDELGKYTKSSAVDCYARAATCARRRPTDMPQLSPRDKSSSCTRRTTTAGVCARTRPATAESSPSAVSSRRRLPLCRRLSKCVVVCSAFFCSVE